MTQQNTNGMEEQYISNEELYALDNERYCERCGVRLDDDDAYLCKNCEVFEEEL